jgi:hypothetical protein
MATVHLFCQDSPGLKLGPNDEIVFFAGFAEFEASDFPQWVEWAVHSGTPFIRIIDEGEATAAGSEHVCPVCGKPFASARAVNGHLLSHKPKAAPPEVATARKRSSKRAKDAKEAEPADEPK